jgi:hypothetical protein
MSEQGSRVIVSTMKDEGPYILEWLAYHKVIGFDHFVVYVNDCWDMTSDILQTMAAHFGIISYWDNTALPDFGDIENQDPQRRAYLRAHRLYRVKQAEYVLVIDADEFLNVHAGSGTLDDLIDAAPPFEAMSLTWKLFGSSGRVEMTDDFVIDQFTQCKPDQQVSVMRKLGVKTLFRPNRVEKIGVHRPFHLDAIRKGQVSIPWLNGSGIDHFDYYKALSWHATPETQGNVLAEINHYPIKSAEAFLMKMRRGSANSHDADRISWMYWEYYDLNDAVDTSIQRHIPAVKAQIQDWYAQCPELEKLHRASFDMHKSIASEMKKLLQQDDPRFLAGLKLPV